MIIERSFQLNDNTTQSANESETVNVGFLQKIDSYIFSIENPIEKPIPVISLDDKTISTAGNITVFTGQSKSGKSAVSSGLIAGATRIKGSIIDTVNFEVQLSEGKIVVHYDTEQSLYDHFRFNESILNRTGRDKENYKSYNLRSFTPKERIKAVELTLERDSQIFGGIHSIFIDGCADFVSSVNDEIECGEFVRTLESWAIKYSCPVITVLHLNPGTVTSKSRGHLGSHLERKAESVFEITKDQDSEISTIQGKLFRNAGRVPEVQFQYDFDKGYHIGLGIRRKSQKQEQKEIELKDMASKLLSGSMLSYTALKAKLMDEFHMSESTAKRKINAMEGVSIEKFNDKYKRIETDQPF
jgi:hypothetical protein